MPEKWYQDQKEVVSFGQILEACDEFEDTEAVHYYYEKPHKWNPEYLKWQELGEPIEEDDEHWEDFVAYLDER